MLIKAIMSANIAYILALNPPETCIVFPEDAFGQLGFARRVKGEPGNTVGIFTIDLPIADDTKKYIKNF